MDALRHTYLHFVLDPLIAKRATALERLKPILLAVQRAPMAEEYKRDMGLAGDRVPDSRHRGARLPPIPSCRRKSALALVQRDEAEGFVLTGYFYEQLRHFEKASIGLQDAFPNWLHNMDVGQREEAGQPDRVCRPGRARGDAGLQTRISAEDRFGGAGSGQRQSGGGREAGAGEPAGQRRPGPRLFCAGQSGQLQRRHAGRADRFSEGAGRGQRSARGGLVPHLSGAHSDMQGERDDAVAQYKAALAISDVPPDAKTAAERGSAAALPASDAPSSKIE